MTIGEEQTGESRHGSQDSTYKKPIHLLISQEYLKNHVQPFKPGGINLSHTYQRYQEQREEP